MAAIIHIKSREDNNHCLELRFYFNDKYQHIVINTLGDWVIYYQPMPRAGKRAIRIFRCSAQSIFIPRIFLVIPKQLLSNMSSFQYLYLLAC